MKLPRDLSGDDRARARGRLGDQVTRQTGSHMRLTTTDPTEHHVTVPRHDSLRIGTLSAIRRAIAEHREMSRDDLINFLFP